MIQAQLWWFRLWLSDWGGDFVSAENVSLTSSFFFVSETFFFRKWNLPVCANDQTEQEGVETCSFVSISDRQSQFDKHLIECWTENRDILVASEAWRPASRPDHCTSAASEQEHLVKRWSCVDRCSHLCVQSFTEVSSWDYHGQRDETRMEKIYWRSSLVVKLEPTEAVPMYDGLKSFNWGACLY